MSVIYMISWSIVMTCAVGVGRIQDFRQTATVATVAALVLLMTQALAGQLAATVGLESSMIFVAPELFLQAGPAGWLALLVMPCGWLGPIIGMNFVRDRFEAMGLE